MDEQTADKIINATHWPRMMAAAALGVLAVFLFIAAIGELRGLRFIGTGVPATNTVTVSGEGEVFAVPDIATFSVSVQEEAKEVQDAQESATKKTNEIIAYLKQQGIEERDIRTTDYNVYPQYDYIQSVCREGICPPGRQELRGYQVSQTLAIKVRDTDKAGELLSGVGSRGANNVSGLSFTIDDEDALQAEARGMAIDDARAKAAELAKQLNVRLVRVVVFYEDSGGYYPPIAYGMGGDSAFTRAEMAMAAPAPDIPVGENKIVIRVNVTYEIR